MAPPLTLHPAVRILLLLVTASTLPAMSLTTLAVIGGLGLTTHWRLSASALDRLRGGLWRLRWLLLAIFVLYGGFTPGEPLLPALPGLSREGLAEGLRRMLVLVDLLVLVYLLLAVTPTTQLVVGVRVLLAPLRILGVEPERVGLRIALALEAVSGLQQRLRGDAGVPLWTRAAALIEAVERDAATAAAPVDLSDAGLPRWWEWLLPPLLFAGLYVLAYGGGP
ncbi:hypothetical protein [Sinimarinibacterium flocculans]|uniref:hypothetical protein n=1 Tax=Sinimarinibacterium flocculans TaxID=985250 RepID=UPI003517A594